MKKLLLLICLLPLFAQAQFTNQTVRKTIATGTLSTNPGLDTIPRVTGVLTNGYVLMFNSSLNKWYAVDPSTFSPSLSVSTVSPGGYANGLNYASGVFRLGKVSATNPGVLTTGTDTIAGNKVFTGEITGQTLGTTRWTMSNTAGENGLKSNVSGVGGGLYLAANNSPITIKPNDGTGGSYTTFNANGTVTLSSLTTGSVYSSSGTLTNTAPTSGTIGYWSRSGTTLSPSTANDNVSIGTGTFSATGQTLISGFYNSTNARYAVQSNNQGGTLYVMNESSTGGSLFTGSSAYAGVVGMVGVTPRPLEFGTDGAIRYSIGTTGNHDFKTGTATFGGALTGTTATFSGTITSTRTSGAILNAVSSTTGSPFVNFQSTSGQLLTGIEASAGGSIATGSTAYSTFFGNQVAKPIDFFTNGVVRYTIDASGNNTWTNGGAFGGAVTGVTASPNSNDTKFATTAYVDRVSTRQLEEWYTDASNSGSSLTDLYTFTVPGNTLNVDGDKLEFTVSGIYANNTNAKTLNVSLGISGHTFGISTSLGGTWIIQGTIIRTSATTYRTSYIRSETGSAVSIQSGSASVTNFTGSNDFKIRGTGVSSTDITATNGTLEFKPAAL